MSFNRGGLSGGKRAGGRGFDQGPPDRVIPLGHYTYSCEDDHVCKVEIDDVPYFNAPIYLENKEQIGKIDEIFGTIRNYSVTVKLWENIRAKSFKAQQELFIGPAKLLPIARFLPKPPQRRGGKKKCSDGGVVANHGGSLIRGGTGGNNRGVDGFNRGGVGGGFNKRGFRRGSRGGSGFKCGEGGRW